MESSGGGEEAACSALVRTMDIFHGIVTAFRALVMLDNDCFPASLRADHPINFSLLFRLRFSVDTGPGLITDAIVGGVKAGRLEHGAVPYGRAVDYSAAIGAEPM
jgi:hypothetical protein